MPVHNPMLWVNATRPAFLSVTVVAVLLGLSTAKYNGVYHSTWLAAVTLVFALIAHAGANVINDYYDALSGCDAANVDRIYPFTGGSRFIQDGLLSTKQTSRFGYLLLIAVVPAGLYLISQSGIGLLIIGLCGLFAGWAYSATPLKLQSRGIGEITIILAWMLIVIGADYVQRGAFTLTPVIVGLAYGLLVANVLFINQVPDIKADAASGKNTLIVRLGFRIAPFGSMLFYLASSTILLCGIAANWLPRASIFSLVFWFFALVAIWNLHKYKTGNTSLTLIIKLTITSTLTFGMLMTIALINAS